MYYEEKIILGVLAVVLGLWTILPDPAPVLIDDIIAGLGATASLLGLIKSFLEKQDQDDSANK